EEHVDVLRATFTVDDASKDLLEPRGALATRRALAARLLCEETDDAMAGAYDVGVLVHHDDGSGAEHRACLADGTRLERQIEMLFEQPRRRRPTWDERLQPLPVAHAAAVDRRLDQVAEPGDTELDLVHARPADGSRPREHP